ncbi:MAG: hypothetical protein HYR55_07920 [Acidobacteria bacterium]|nr:hypothetical protein [Acidobacteriota bacterium]
MKCAYHTTTDSVQLCLACNRPLCPACAHQVRGSAYCEECLVHGAEWAATVRHLRVPKAVANRAALLAIIPGMGAVYNNQYFKALVYLVIFFALCLAADIHGIFVFAALSFYAFMMVDSYRTAEEIQRQRVQEGDSTLHQTIDVTSPLWGGLVIVLGLILTLSNYINISEQIRRLWPLVIILLGLFMVYRSVSGNKT